MNDEISYEGIDEAVLIHGLYHGTRPLGLGFLQNVDGLTVDQVRAELASAYKRPEYGVPALDAPNEEHDGNIRFDYFHGRPLKLTLNTKAKTFAPRLYDRDAGSGAAQRVVDSLRVAAKKAG